MTEKEYYYNVELLDLLENIISVIPGCAINDGYFMSCVDDLRERLDNMFDGERREVK